MVIPYIGAISAFLSIFNALPVPVKSFILTALFILGGVALLERVVDL